MAADAEQAELFAELYDETWITGALKILLESQAEPDDVVNQYLAEEGYTMKIKGSAERNRMISTLNAARKIKGGDTPFTNDAHVLSRQNRRIRT